MAQNKEGLEVVYTVDSITGKVSMRKEQIRPSKAKAQPKPIVKPKKLTQSLYELGADIINDNI